MSTTLSLRSPRRAVLADLIRTNSRLVDAALVLAGIAVMSVLAQISIAVPGSPVPVTGQTLGVGLVGASLGARRGTAAMIGYVLAGLALPVYSDGSSGWHVLSGATGGYLIGFIAAGWVIGRLAERAADRKVLTAFVAFAVAQLLIFGFGLAGLKLNTGQDWAWVIDKGFTPFVVGGLIKAAIGGALLPAAWRGVRSLDR